MSTKELQISEIFYSIQGEGKFTGFPSHFVRVSGCNLRCAYCDTKYSWSGGEVYSFERIFNMLSGFPPTPIITLTGGEPLLQEKSIEFLKECGDRYRIVILETNGSISIKGIPEFVHISLDLKPPSSGFSHMMVWENLDYLKERDEVRILIASREDFDWAMEINERYEIGKKFFFSLTPVYGILSPQVLAQWILERGGKIRINLQLHKIIWGNSKGR